MQNRGVAQVSRRKNGSLNIQKQGYTLIDEIASDWWGGRAGVDCLFSRGVVIRTACKLICCRYRKKTNLNKNAFCFFMYFYSAEKNIRGTDFLVIFHSRVGF